MQILTQLVLGRESILGWWLALAAGLCGLSPAAADQFLLRNGARIGGEWLNRDERPLKSYLIRTDQGGLLSIAPGQVVRFVHQAAAATQYESIAPRHADTAESQWKLAVWCRQQRLGKQAELHFRRVVELDPDHMKARYALGYSQLHGRWVRQEEVLSERGYVLFQGKWRLPQEVELLQVRQRDNEAERRWYVNTKRWRSQLSTAVAQTALEHFRRIEDPNAIPALEKLLREDRHRGVRLLCVEVLGRIDDDRSTRLLIDTALGDKDEEVFHACVDQLVSRRTPQLTKRFAEALMDVNNHRVNRAGYALGQLQDENAIEPLIEALVTTHLVARPDPSGQAPGSTTAGFMRRNDADMGAYFSVRNGPQIAEFRQVNQGVLGGLEKLAELSFGYNQRAWREWHARRRLQNAAATLGRAAVP